MDTTAEPVAEPAEESFALLRQALAAPERFGWRSRLPDIDVGAVATGAGAAFLLGAGILAIGALRSPDGPARTEVPIDISATAAVASPAPTATTAVTRAARVWPAEPVTVEGQTVRRGDDRWTVGAAGDVIAIGDWDCDGSVTPAVLRPSIGLFVFDRWAEGNATENGRPVPGAAAGIAVRAVGCGAAEVHNAGGSAHVLPTRPER